MGTYYGFFLPQIINFYVEYNFIIKQYTSASLYLIFFLNPIVNPIIYAWMSPDFKTAFKTILRLNKSECRKPNTTMTNLTNVRTTGASAGHLNLPQNKI